MISTLLGMLIYMLIINLFTHGKNRWLWIGIAMCVVGFNNNQIINPNQNAELLPNGKKMIEHLSILDNVFNYSSALLSCLGFILGILIADYIYNEGYFKYLHKDTLKMLKTYSQKIKYLYDILKFYWISLLVMFILVALLSYLLSEHHIEDIFIGIFAIIVLGAISNTDDFYKYKGYWDAHHFFS